MNRTKIEWCDYTWNPITGCSNGCPYCYARRIVKRFPNIHGFEEGEDGLTGKLGLSPQPFSHPVFHPERLHEPQKVKKPSRIFVCSMGDLFDPHLSHLDRWEVFRVIKQCPQHTFITLTKRPEVAIEFWNYGEKVRGLGRDEWPKNWWHGMSVTCQKDLMGSAMFNHFQNPAALWFLSIEPMRGPVDLEESGIVGYMGEEWEDLSNVGLGWVIVGFQTPGTHHPEGGGRAVQNVIDYCRDRNVPVFIKDNVGWHEKIQEIPEG